MEIIGRNGEPSLVQCLLCGVERDGTDLPDLCPICLDERQYPPADGIQRWVDPSGFSGTIAVVELEPGLWGIDVESGVGIGQQAKLVVTPAGTVMFDVPAAIDDEAVAAVRRLGPLRAIIPSHPHMFGLQSLWSRMLDDAPVYVSAADAEWAGHRPPALRLWTDTLEPVPGVVASQPGGHFPGSSVVHFTGADGTGVLLGSDTVFVNPDLRTVSFMRSYPNRLPLSAAVAERVATHVGRYDFDRLYGNFTSSIGEDARARVLASARRHAAWVSGEFDHLTR